MTQKLGTALLISAAPLQCSSEGFDISILIETPFYKKNIIGTAQLANVHLPYFQETVVSPLDGWRSTAVDIAVMVGKWLWAYKIKKDYKKKVQKFVTKYQDWTKDQFVHQALMQQPEFFSSHNYDAQKAILAEYHLYQFKGFQEFIKDFSSTKYYLRDLLWRLKSDSEFCIVMQSLPGFFELSFQEVVEGLLK